MDKRGIFVLSLDCEGKWGVADHLGGNSMLINDRSLLDAYSYIHDELSDKKFKSTMAFTSLFTIPEIELKSHADSIREMAALGYSWYDPIIDMIDNENLDGWLGNSYFNQALQAGHDIAWHGFSHHILADYVDDYVAKYEIQSGVAISEMHGIDINSVIYPRNQVGKKSLLASYGFKCYRAGLYGKNESLCSRYVRVIDEFNIIKNSQFDSCIYDSSGMVELPSGYFLNWPSGFRSLVPCNISVKRWKSMLDDAVKNQKQVHMWFHPHNLITAPKMRETFSKVLSIVSDYVKTGDIQVKTMSELNANIGDKK